MKKTLLIACVLSTLAFAGAVSAQERAAAAPEPATSKPGRPSAMDREMTYTFAGVGLLQTSNEVLPNLSGAYVNGSVELAKGISLVGEVGNGSGELEDSKVDRKHYSAGIVVALPIHSRVDLMMSYEFENQSLDVNLEDNRGFKHNAGNIRNRVSTGELGLRASLTERLEAWGTASYSKSMNVSAEYNGTGSSARFHSFVADLAANEDPNVRVGALFKMNPLWGMTAETVLNSEYQDFAVGIRRSF